MDGMNAIFHLAALGAALGLAWGLLRVQRQRDLLRRLAQGVHKVEVSSPIDCLRALAAALGVSFEVTGSYVLPPRRVRSWVLFEILTGRGVTLVRCVNTIAKSGAEADLLVEISVARAMPDPAARAAVETAAAEALGERVLVSIKGEP